MSVRWQQEVEQHLALFAEALAGLPAAERDNAMRELRAHLEDVARTAADPDAAVREALRSLGDPRAYAASLARGAGPRRDPDDTRRMLGVPVELRRPSAERLARRLWNPADPRVLVPRVFGIGWDINFGALAVKLRLVRPDDEEPLPFGSVPEAALRAGLALATLIDVAAVLLAIALRDAPPRVPVHWALSGPDRFATPLVAAVVTLSPSVVLNAYVGWLFLRRASRLARTLGVSVLSSAAVFLGGLHANGLVFAVRGRSLYPAALPLVAGLLLLFGLLLVFSRLGVHAEWRRDFSARR